VKAQSLRVLSYNIHQGITARRNKLSLAALIQAISSLKPDVVVLQEVAGLWTKAHANVGPDWLAHPLDEITQQGAWPHAVYGRNAVFSEHFHGNAILSRYPIVDWHNEDISVGRAEPRGLLHAAVRLPCGSPFHILGVHLGLRHRERSLQVERLCRYSRMWIGHKDPLFVVGDFNDWGSRLSTGICAGLGVREAKSPRTYPSRFPLFNLDRIYFRGVSCLSSIPMAGRSWRQLSDHLPLLAEFKWPQPFLGLPAEQPSLTFV
jgi:endonuclease/exonuclease/phosphatase family metal-dependent hydrolase